MYDDNILDCSCCEEQRGRECDRKEKNGFLFGK